MLDQPDESLSVIAEKVGYTEHANFSRQFKLITGESPLLWKKQQISEVISV
jgi:AraC-like DNA-binding protein